MKNLINKVPEQQQYQILREFIIRNLITTEIKLFDKIKSQLYTNAVHIIAHSNMRTLIT